MIKKTLEAVTLLFLLNFSATLLAAPLALSSIQWSRQPDSPPLRGVILLGHGLNLKPTKMDELAQFLAGEGFEVGRFSLSGHDGNLAAFKAVTYEKWKAEFLTFNEDAKARAKKEGVPLYFVGFSLSGALAEDLLNRVPSQVSFKKLVLFAPAIVTRWYTHGIPALNIFGSQLCLPSANLLEYRANDCTSIGAYNALFAAIKSLRDSDHRYSQVPTLVLIDPEDELVSYSGIRSLIENAHLKDWQLEEVHHVHPTVEHAIHHMIIDEASLGKEPWTKVLKDLRAFLLAPKVGR